MSTGLNIKVLTSKGNIRVADGLEGAYKKWKTQQEEGNKLVDIYNTLISECAIDGTPHVTLTIFYRLVPSEE